MILKDAKRAYFRARGYPVRIINQQNMQKSLLVQDQSKHYVVSWEVLISKCHTLHLK